MAFMTASVTVPHPASDGWRSATWNATGRWLSKHRNLLLLLTALGGIAAVVSPWLWLNVHKGGEVVFLFSNETWWYTFRVASIVIGVAAVLAVIADKVADGYDARVAKLVVHEGEKAAEKSIDDLNVFLGEAIRTMFFTGRRQEDAIETLRRTMVTQSARSVGLGSRATCYNLHREPTDKRVLKEAVHGIEHPRRDKSNTPFFERLDPGLDIWRMLDREDDEPNVRSCEDEDPVVGLDWSKKEYKTFLSVPIKAVNVQLGMLSVNNSELGSIGGPQRAVTLAMARTYALVVAASKGAAAMNDLAAEQDKRDALRQMSETSATVAASEEGSTK